MPVPSRVSCPKWTKTNAHLKSCCCTRGYYVGSMQRLAYMTGSDSHDGNINTLPVFPKGLCLNLAVRCTFLLKVHLLEMHFQVLFSKVQACNDIIISRNTESRALVLGSLRCLQLRHLSAQLRRFPLLRMTRTALTGNSGTYNCCIC